MGEGREGVRRRGDCEKAGGIKKKKSKDFFSNIYSWVRLGCNKIKISILHRPGFFFFVSFLNSKNNRDHSEIRHVMAYISHKREDADF